MAELAKKGLLYLMSEKCYDNYFEDFNFLDGDQSSLLLHKKPLIWHFFDFSPLLQGASQQGPRHRHHRRLGASQSAPDHEDPEQQIGRGIIDYISAS